MRTLNELNKLTLEWSKDRGILTNGKATTQALKLGSEFGELCDNLAKGLSIKDDLGDMIVVITNLAALEGLSLVECWNHAYDDIKDRKGFLNENGTFIKNTDKSLPKCIKVFSYKRVNLFENEVAIICDFDDNSILKGILKKDSINANSFKGMTALQIKEFVDEETTIH